MTENCPVDFNRIHILQCRVVCALYIPTLIACYPHSVEVWNDNMSCYIKTSACLAIGELYGSLSKRSSLIEPLLGYLGMGNDELDHQNGIK